MEEEQEEGQSKEEYWEAILLYVFFEYINLLVSSVLKCQFSLFFVHRCLVVYPPSMQNTSVYIPNWVNYKLIFY